MRRDNPQCKVVDIAGVFVSNNPTDVLVTYSLGSCVGVTLYDPIHKVGGMIHCMLPVSSSDQERAKNKPSMYVDVGMIDLIQKLYDLGAEKKNLVCKIAGAGTPLQDNGFFRIGERNYAVLRKILLKNSILIKGECVGGKSAKTLYLYMETGETFVRLDGKEEITL